jgi:hypothetical protein
MNKIQNVPCLNLVDHVLFVLMVYDLRADEIVLGTDAYKQVLFI